MTFDKEKWWEELNAAMPLCQRPDDQMMKVLARVYNEGKKAAVQKPASEADAKRKKLQKRAETAVREEIDYALGCFLRDYQLCFHSIAGIEGFSEYLADDMDDIESKEVDAAIRAAIDSFRKEHLK